MIKPDVMLVTKNHMVPLVMPVPKNKLFHAPCAAGKKTKIVRARKKKCTTKQISHCAEKTNYLLGERTKQFSQQLLRSTDYSDYDYDSLVDWEQESKENYELLYSQEFTIDNESIISGMNEGTKRLIYSSQSYPAQSMPFKSYFESYKTFSITSDSKTNNTIDGDVKNTLLEQRLPSKSCFENCKTLSLISDTKTNTTTDADPKNILSKPPTLSKNSFENYKSFSTTSDTKINNPVGSDAKNIISMPPMPSEICFENNNNKKNEFTILETKLDLDFRKNSIEELRRCVSNEIIKYSESIEKERDKQAKYKDCEIKYSWQDLDNWIPPSEKKKIAEIDKQSELFEAKKRNCKITYSWQIIGTGVQTSYELIQSLLPKSDEREEKASEEKNNYPCKVKYSWQIIGTGTQVSFRDAKDSLLCDDDYWDGKIISGKRFANSFSKNEHSNSEPCKIHYSERTQTTAEKAHQTELSNCRVKYSWQNLTEPYLKTARSAYHGVKNEKAIVTMEPEIDMPQDGGEEDILDKTLSASFTDETEPLMPTVDYQRSDNNETKSEIDSRKTRLACALKKLEQSEECIEANWSLEYSLPTRKDEITRGDEKLPRHVQDNVKGIILSAQEYIDKLEDQLSDLDIADEQIVKSTERVMREIDETYQDLMNRVCREINKRRDLMRLEAEIYKNESLAPLRGCRQQVNAQIRSSRNLVSELNRALIETTLKKPQECKIIEASSKLGRIPAVPLPEELPYVAFSPPANSIVDETIRAISEFGSVLRMGPAQIVEIEERPASLYIKWHIADPEYATEEQTYVVQKANGEIHDIVSDAFEIVYEGTENWCFVRDIPVDEPITLRVGLQAMESAWSIHRFAKTKIPAYSWTLDNKDYMITNGGKIAAKISDRKTTLFSRGPQVDANQIIEFKFLEASLEGENNEGIALVSESMGPDDSLCRSGALLVTTRGKIFMDGVEKLMRLPRMRFGSRLVFTIMRKDDDSLRINIESADKAVTYDWTVQTPLLFAARFKESNKWNFIVK